MITDPNIIIVTFEEQNVNDKYESHEIHLSNGLKLFKRTECMVYPSISSNHLKDNIKMKGETRFFLNSNQIIFWQYKKGVLDIKIDLNL